ALFRGGGGPAWASDRGGEGGLAHAGMVAGWLRGRIFRAQEIGQDSNAELHEATAGPLPPGEKRCPQRSGKLAAVVGPGSFSQVELGGLEPRPLLAKVVAASV